MRARDRSVLVWLGVLGMLWCSTSPAAGAGPAEKAGDQWAVLIAVARHEDPSLNLKYTVADVEALQRTLRERAGIPADHILEMSDRSPAERRPTLANLRRELPRFLARLKPADRVIVFFSGHGFLANEHTFLVPADFQRKAALQTGLPAGEVRSFLTRCPCAVKFLILDCCHAGSERAVHAATLPAETLARALEPKGVPGCVVLAGCRADEKSFEWEERRQGVFTYWLCRALEGGADADSDGQLTIDEVYRYTYERVSQTVAQLYATAATPVSQTPVRLIGGGVTGVPVVLTLRPEPPESLCRRLAEHLDLELRRHKLKKVGVPEFLEPLGRAEGLTRANLPTFCSEQVRTALTRLGGASYQVVGREQLSQAMKGVQVEELGDPAALHRLRQRTGGVDALVVGILRRRGAKLHVQCDLVAMADGNSLVTPSGVLPLSEELLADNGASFDNRLRPSGSPYLSPVVNHVTQQAHQGHPLLDQTFPFRLEVWSVQPRPGETVGPQTPRKRKEFVLMPSARKEGGRDLLIAARSGELFEIRVWNNSKGRVAMVLLVDGINTLGQQRERLGQAWPWILEPQQNYAVEGWFLPRRPDAQAGQWNDFILKRFQFTDVAQSVARRKQFGESLGLITAAFYAERGRALGVGEGPEEQRNLHSVKFQAGRLLGVAQVRYVDERDLDRLLNDPGTGH